MKWEQTSEGRWFSIDGRGRISRYDRAGDPPYFAMWHRVEPGRGRWLQVSSASGRATYRRSLPASCEAVQAAVENVDRAQEREAA